MIWRPYCTILIQCWNDHWLSVMHVYELPFLVFLLLLFSLFLWHWWTVTKIILEIRAFRAGVPNQFWVMLHFGISNALMLHCNVKFLHIQNFTVIHLKEAWRVILASKQILAKYRLPRQNIACLTKISLATPKYCMPHQNIACFTKILPLELLVKRPEVEMSKLLSLSRKYK